MWIVYWLSGDAKKIWCSVLIAGRDKTGRESKIRKPLRIAEMNAMIDPQRNGNNFSWIHGVSKEIYFYDKNMHGSGLEPRKRTLSQNAGWRHEP